MLAIWFRSKITNVFLKRVLERHGKTLRSSELVVLLIKLLVYSLDLELTCLKTTFETRYKVELAESLTQNP